MVSNTRHPNPGVRNKAIRALGLLGDRRAIAALVDALRDEGGVPVEVFYYPKWLGDRLPMGEVEGPVPFGIGASFNAERAVQALGRLGGSEAVSAIEVLLEDPSCMFKDVVADVLGQIGAADVVPALDTARAEALKSGDTGLAYWCRRGALHIRARTAESGALLGQLHDRDGAVVFVAALELAHRRTKDAIPALGTLVEDQRIIQTDASYPTINCTIGAFAKWCLDAIGGAQVDAAP
jgi:HEAT repeat protein